MRRESVVESGKFVLEAGRPKLLPAFLGVSVANRRLLFANELATAHYRRTLAHFQFSSSFVFVSHPFVVWTTFYNVRRFLPTCYGQFSEGKFSYPIAVSC